MNGTSAESHRAGAEARRETVSSTGHSGTDTRYNAMLRYLRGLYVRSPQAPQKASAPKAQTPPETEPDTPAAEPVEPGEPPVEPKA
ncbi:hypothetical protein [Actinocrinis sp.]|uniref:hypothetical protein n=1 Tax=Actinocrinis sp. TaxID=1920516 RepID=UPI002D750DB3|nr:hypothetical protein [Actinocrinis sp.]HZP51321.1 hypothetical protein [Actinocrinis sp.]